MPECFRQLLQKEISRNISGLKQVPDFSTFADEVLAMGSYKNIASTRYTNDKQITDHYAIIPTGQGLGALQESSSAVSKCL